MSWVEENKGAGPWDFTEQPAKWGYLNNPRWSSQADAIAFCQAHGLPLDLPNQHLPCGHWHKGYTAPPITYDECSLEPLFDWPEFVSNESFIGYNGEKVFILQKVYNDGKVYVYNVNGGLITSFSTMATNPACMQCLAVDNDYCFVGAGANVIGPVLDAHIARFNHSGGGSTYWTVIKKPLGICSDGDHVYATSTYGLQKYTRSGSLVWEFPYYGAGVGEFYTVYGLWSDKTHLFVADYSQGKILKYLCSDGSFVLEADNMVPPSARDITVDDRYAYVSMGWGMSVFYKDTLEYICAPVFDDYAYNPNKSIGSITYDGEYWWGLSKDTTVVKFDIHVFDDPITVEGEGSVSDEPQVWTMPGQ